MNKMNRGVDVVLYVDERPVAGQLGAILNQMGDVREITNLIDGSWKEYISTLKGWTVRGNGMFVVNADSLRALENAFLNNLDIDIILTLDGQQYKGQGLITNFPISAVFNQEVKYTIEILGNGPLSVV